MFKAFNDPAVLVAFFNFAGIAVAGFFSWRASVLARKSMEVSKENTAKLEENTAITEASASHIVKIKEDIHAVELATNSMKDELVKATGEAAFAAGEKSEQDKQK